MDNNSVLSSAKQRENLFLKKVYLWMAGGLLVTALTAFLVASSATLMRALYSNALPLILLFVAEFAIVFILSGRIEKLSSGAAIGCFLAYSTINGATLSSLVYLYAGTNILSLAFVTTAVVFVVAALYGTFTKRSIKGWGGWLSMGLIAIIVVSLVNMFIGSSRLDMIISIAGVAIFTLLTAWDSQKVLAMNNNYGAMMSEDELNKISILGALELYLDFINILLYLVRIFASRRDN